MKARIQTAIGQQPGDAGSFLIVHFREGAPNENSVGVSHVKSGNGMLPGISGRQTNDEIGISVPVLPQPVNRLKCWNSGKAGVHAADQGLAASLNIKRPKTKGQLGGETWINLAG